MAINIITPWGVFNKPGHYGPICVGCGAPIMFDQMRKRNSKCDKCNGFKVHSCIKAFDLKHDPNKENNLNHEFWFSDGQWWGELSYQNGNAYIEQHFKVSFCAFCGLDLYKSIDTSSIPTTI